MSVRMAQREIDSAEFAEWRAYYRLLDAEQTQDPGEEPAPDELSSKIHAWAASHNATKAAQER